MNVALSIRSGTEPASTPIRLDRPIVKCSLETALSPISLSDARFRCMPSMIKLRRIYWQTVGYIKVKGNEKKLHRASPVRSIGLRAYDAALRRIRKSRHSGHKFANISVDCQRI